MYTFTAVEPMMCVPGIAKKVKAYCDGEMEVREALAGGSSRADLKNLLQGSYSGNYWDSWAGFRRQ